MTKAGVWQVDGRRTMRGGVLISGPRIFVLLSLSSSSRLFPTATRSFYVFPSPLSPSGNSSLYDLVWPGRISDTRALPLCDPDMVAQRTVKYFFLNPTPPSISFDHHCPHHWITTDPGHPIPHNPSTQHQSGAHHKVLNPFWP